MNDPTSNNTNNNNNTTPDGSTTSSTTDPNEDDRRPHPQRRRMTSHKASLLKIQQDTSHGSSVTGSRRRHVVPDTTHNYHNNNNNESSYADSTDGSPEGWVQQQTTHFRTTLQQRSWKDWMMTGIPFTRWMLQTNYAFRQDFLTDLMAGLTVGVMVVPQSMSYAKLAGLPVEYGLYSSLVPIYAYALWGSSQQLAVGPVALVSLLLNTGLLLVMEKEGYTPDDTENYQAIYNTFALQTSVLVGISFLVMGLLKMGFVTIFLSHAVVSGFTSAAAIIIGLSQIKYFFGYDIPNDKSLHRMLQNIFASIDQFNWRTFLLGTSCVLILMGLKQLASQYSNKWKWIKAVGPLSVTILGITLQASIDLEDRGVPIVGYIPSGFPEFTGSIIFPMQGANQLSAVVLSIVIIGFLESIAIAKQLSSRNNYELDSSLELVGLGMANLGSGLFGGYPVVGSFSRSAVNNEAGAKSQISGLVTATVVGLVLLFLTPVFELMPLAVLASIVISGVISLVDYPEAIYLWKVHKFDFSVWMLAFLGTLFLGVELGLSISVGISLLLVIFESAYPGTSVLGRLPGTQTYRNIKQYPSAELYNGIVMVRVDAPIYFANTVTVREKIHKYYQRASSNGKIVKYIVLEMSPVSHVDTSALHMLSELHSTYQTKLQCQLCLVNPNKGVMHRIGLSGLADELGREHIFVSLHDAVEYCLYEMDQLELKALEEELVVVNNAITTTTTATTMWQEGEGVVDRMSLEKSHSDNDDDQDNVSLDVEQPRVTKES